jgi:bile acid-coenzyme A ligase
MTNDGLYADGTAVPLCDVLAYHALRDPGRPVLTIGDQTINRREMDLSTNRIARAYQAMGVKPDDLVTICLPNGIDVYQAIFAALKCGATPHVISWRLPVVEAQGIVDLAQPALLVGGSADIEAPVRVPEGFTPDPALPDTALEPAISTYWKAVSSGGSTGRPKIIVTHRNSIFDIKPLISGQSVDGTVLTTGPMYNNGPFMTSMLSLVSGNHVVVMPRFDAEETLRLLEKHKVDWVMLVPTMMNRIWRLGEEVRARYDLSHLRIVFHSASICPVWLKQAWIEWLGPEKIIESFASTEAQGVTRINGTDWLEHKGSVGRPVDGSTVLILDPEGQPLPPGEVGEIFFLPPPGAEHTYHYIGSERREIDGAGSSGDMGYLDADGWLFIADRRTDMIVTGGANVYPAEVEAAIDSHPAVLSSVVIGLPDPDMIAVVHGIVQYNPDLPQPSEAEMRAFLKERIVSFKIPRSFETSTAYLRDDAGKARRSAMREERLARMQAAS